MINSEKYYGTTATLHKPRSKFVSPFNFKTTFDVGKLIPLCKPIEILPGDTFSVKSAAAVRMTTPIFPVLDDAYLSTFWFFVPNRLVWDHWQEMLGENNSTAWEQPVEYTVPQITSPASTGWTEGTIADYFGVPTKVPGLSINALPFRGYCKIWNDFFRDQNVAQPCNVTTDDTTTTGANSGDYVLYSQAGAVPLPVSRLSDYFSRALPEPQKGDPAVIPGAIINFMAPVVTQADDIEDIEATTPLHWVDSDGDVVDSNAYIGVKNKDTRYYQPTSPSFVGTNNIVPSNLYAEVTGNAQSVTINDLRQAIAVQRFLEKSASGGTRYTEMLKTFFGVISPDARLQRPEYLGGTRVPINVDQVAQTSSSDATSPQGNVAAFSLTNMSSHVFTHSFVEHGYLFCLGCVRTKHTYQQGLDPLWSVTDKYSFYWPEFSALGNVPIFNKEIYAQGSSVKDDDGNVVDDQVFGYQEYAARYRYNTSQVTGLFRSNATGTLDSWHYADYYSDLPVLSKSWLDEPTAPFKRTIAVQNQPDFIGDFYFRLDMMREIPLFSIPSIESHF